MAEKDIGKGFGDLSGRLAYWYCPGCKNNSSVKDWYIVNGKINDLTMEGRKCPKCEFTAFQYGDTRMMIPLN